MGNTLGLGLVLAGALDLLVGSDGLRLTSGAGLGGFSRLLRLRRRLRVHLAGTSVIGRQGKAKGDKGSRDKLTCPHIQSSPLVVVTLFAFWVER